MKTIEVTPKNEKQEAIDNLKRLFEKEKQIYTICRNVSRSGMSRDISFIVFQNNKPVHISYWLHKAFGYKLAGKNQYTALKIGGCGMDMGYHVVNTVSRLLYADKMGVHDGAYHLPENMWL